MGMQASQSRKRRRKTVNIEIVYKFCRFAFKIKTAFIFHLSIQKLWLRIYPDLVTLAASLLDAATGVVLNVPFTCALCAGSH